MNCEQIIGTPIKVYRRMRCFSCDKCYEIDIENITEETKELKIICPWCDRVKVVTEDYFIKSGDRSVRCD